MNKQVTGKILNKSEFRLHETKHTIDTAAAFEVLHGHLAAYRIKQFLPQGACGQIVDNFWSSPGKVPRIGYGEDGVEAYFVGASHIEKTTQEYLNDAHTSRISVENLFQNAINPIAQFRQSLANFKKNELSFRPAQFNTQAAGDVKAVYWNSLGEFLLEPHDDYAQTKDPKQSDFEIQQAKQVMAINFYAEVPQNAGQLKIWNIAPDDKSRQHLNLTYSGFPYPPGVLEDFEHLTIPVETGDLLVINGNLVHAVLRGNQTALSKDRLLYPLHFKMRTVVNAELESYQ